MTKARIVAIVVTCAALAIGWIAGSRLDMPSALGPAEESIGTGTGEAGLYTCGMHPQVAHEGPGQCPICGMNLVPIGSSHPPSNEAHHHAGVRVSRSFLQNFAVRTTVAERADLPARIRTIGYLDQDEAKLVSISTKFGGWIEKSSVNTVGERVSKGDILFEIYSPELVTAQEEYLAAIEYVGRLRSAEAYPGAVSRAESLVQAATERLRHWDLTSGQIDALRAAGKPTRSLEVYSPASGYVVEKRGDSLEGMKAAPGMTLLKIADHSTLWAKVEFYEHHLRDLRIGLRADISLDAFPGRKWHGRLLFFEPAMNPQTQTLTGYVEVGNSEGRLRPKMYATIEIQLPGARDAVVVPAQSVLRSGDNRAIVIVEAGEGIFEPREVKLGIESDGRMQVVDGLTAGERVVTSSQFLLDSESNLQAAVERLGDQTDGGQRHAH